MFTSYLNDSRQFVYLGSAKSESLHIQCGVPQGSVLGPLLFLLSSIDYTSTIFRIHQTHLISIFLLVTQIFFCANKILSELESTVNNQLKNIYNWLCANKLSLNIEQSSFVIFHLHQKVIPFTVKLVLKNQNLKKLTMKYLGIMIDSHLIWKPLVSYTIKKIKRSTGIISKIRYYVDQKTVYVM